MWGGGGFDPFENFNSMMRQQVAGMMGGGYFGMDNMMMPNLFGHGFNNARQQMIEDHGASHGHRNDRLANRGNAPAFDPFGGGLFGGGLMGIGGPMGNMFQQIEAMKERAANDPNAVIYSESKVIGMMPGADGRIQTYESTDSLRKHGDVKETRSTLRDPTRGVEKMSIGHHIGQRGHVVEKKRINGGDIEQNQQFININKDEARHFDNEWSTVTRNAVVGDRGQLYDDRNQRNLPIEGRRSDTRERHASPYIRSKAKKKNRGPIIEEVD